MNIGSIKQNDAGIFMGRVSTLTVAMTIALREVRSSNPKAPRFEIHALNPAARSWVQVGALFELTSNSTGEAFLNGRIDDPSLTSPLYVSAFRQDDGSYNVVWSRPTRRRDVTAAMSPKGDDSLPVFPGDGDHVADDAHGTGDASIGDDRDAGRTRSRRSKGTGTGQTEDGLGETTAEFTS